MANDTPEESVPVSVESAQELVKIKAARPAAKRAAKQNRARSKTVYLDQFSTTELRVELEKEIRDFTARGARRLGSSTEYVPVQSRADEFAAEAQEAIPNRLFDWSGLVTDGADAPPPVRHPVFDPNLALTTVLTSAHLAGYEERLAASQAQPVVSSRVDTVSSAEGMPPVVGFLVSFDRNPSGEILTLRVGRSIVTSQPAGGGWDSLVVSHQSVSTGHATVKVSADGSIHILDQYSEGGTAILRRGASGEERLHGTSAIARHGDKVRFGVVVFQLCALPLNG